MAGMHSDHPGAARVQGACRWRHAVRLVMRAWLTRLQSGGMVGAACAMLAGCGGGPPQAPVTVTALPASAAIVSTQTVVLTPNEISSVLDSSTDPSYVLGPSDIIAVTVYMHPELDVPVPNVSGNVGGALITSDGTVQLPLIGDVRLGGLTLAQAHERLTSDYARYVNNPAVAIEIQQAQSLRYYLLGAFTSPGVKYPNHQLTLLDALALGGTVNMQEADLYQAYVARDAVRLPVDLHALLVDGDMSQNLPLRAGDAIVVPTSTSEDAYLFGAVTKPGPVRFESGRLSLLQALSGAGLDLPSLTDARLSQVHIIRSDGKAGQFIVVNASMIIDGKAAAFDLQPGDIVFVPPNGIATWNQVLNQLLPSLQTVNGILNPFVSIKYLRQRN